MGFLERLFKRPEPEPEAAGGVVRRWTVEGRLEVALFVGEIVDAPAEALCTSTNPRLSLGGGTGKAVLEETGWGLKRRLEAVVEEEARRTGWGPRDGPVADLGFLGPRRDLLELRAGTSGPPHSPTNDYASRMN